MPGKPSSSSPIPSSPDARRGLPRPRRATSPAPTFLPVQPSHTSDASVLLPRMRRSLRAVACCRIWGGKGNPAAGAGGVPLPPQAPHPLPCALLSRRMKDDATRKPPFAHLSPDDTKERLFRQRRSSRYPAEKKESPFPSGKNVHAGENHHAGNETPRWSGHGLGKTTTPASRGAEAIPATRERSSRRAYRPRSGKMRADLPPAASDGQGTRQATATPAATRDKGEYGGRRGCRGARPSHPLPHLCCRCP